LGAALRTALCLTKPRSGFGLGRCNRKAIQTFDTHVIREPRNGGRRENENGENGLFSQTLLRLVRDPRLAFTHRKPKRVLPPSTFGVQRSMFTPENPPPKCLIHKSITLNPTKSHHKNKITSSWQVRTGGSARWIDSQLPAASIS